LGSEVGRIQHLLVEGRNGVAKTLLSPIVVDPLRIRIQLFISMQIFRARPTQKSQKVEFLHKNVGT
jgi:hypothetical protein